MRSLYAAALVLALGTVGCGASGGSPDVPVNGSSPSQAIPPDSLQVPTIPPIGGFYPGIPKACSALDANTLQAIAPGSGAGTEYDESPTPHGLMHFVLSHSCAWQASDADWSRTLTVSLDFTTGRDARDHITRLYRNSVEFLENTIPVGGLGDKALFTAARNDTASSAVLTILRQNVIIQILYKGMDGVTTGVPMTTAELRDGAMDAAYSVIASLH